MATETPELFDMVTDPFERFNRAKSEPEKVRELRSRMEEIVKEVGVKMSGYSK